eukprot:gene876-8501_t
MDAGAAVGLQKADGDAEGTSVADRADKDATKADADAAAGAQKADDKEEAAAHD